MTSTATASFRPVPHALAAALATLLGAPLAHAGGFQLLEQTASGIGNAYAGSAAVAENASTIYFNPAGMTELRDREASLGASVIKLSAKFSDRGSSTGIPNLPSPLAGNGGDAGTTALVPNAYLSWKLNPQLWAGIGLSAPFGLKTEYDTPWVGGAQAIHFDVKTVNFNPSLAFKASDTLSFGFGLNYQKLDADYLRNVAVTSAALGASTVQFKADDWAWGWNAGVLFKPTADTKVGFSYRSSIRHTVKGDLTTGGVGGAPLAAAGNSQAEANIKLPDTAILSLSQRVAPQWEVLGDVSWTGWSSIQNVDIVRTSATAANPAAAGTTAQRLDTEFRNTWRLALGANYRWSNEWTFKGGLAYDQTPVRGPTTRLVSLPDANRTWLSVGAQWRPDADKRVDFGLARIFIKDTTINNNQASTGRGVVVGDYRGNLWLFGLQYSQAF